ncbi:hypothetical protein A9995_05065 [Erythrobacter sp. QSSC1-22B]|nr:hypothetical protein A9995_05065 [Erythrobacter sp. QSSC1-22B]
MGDGQRTDPRSFIVGAIASLGQVALPLAFGAYAVLDGEPTRLLFAIPAVLAILAVSTALSYLNWYRFTYRIGASDIRVESGVISRAARSVPYERIQDVSLEQKLIPRLFGLVEVRFETGAGGKDELKLSYLAEAEGERLREVVRSQKDGAVVMSDEGAPAETCEALPPLFAMGPRRVVTFGLFEFSLAVVAVGAGAAQQFDFLLPFDLWDFDAWQDRLAGPGRWLAGLGVAAQIAGGTIAVVTFTTLGFLTGLVRTGLREWDFRLERTDKGLRRRRGLLTRTDVVMPIHRVQALRMGTGVVRRWFGWRELKVVSLAQDSGSANHSVAPFAQAKEIAPIVAVTGFHLPDEGLDWQRATRQYRTDQVVMAGLVMFPLAVGLAVAGQGLLALLPLAGFAVIAAMEFANWRFVATGVDASQLFLRRNFLAPRLAIASRVKLQSVEISQGPIARRRGYATLSLGLAGGKFAISGISLDRARELRAAVLESIAGRDFSELV